MKKTLAFLASLLLYLSATQAQSWHILDSLAGTAYEKGDYKTSIDWELKALHQAEIEFGKEDSNYAESLHDLAYLYYVVGDFPKAEPFLKQAVEIRRKVLGENSPKFAQSFNNLALLYYRMGDYTEAELFLKQGLEINRKLLGENHPDFALSLSNLASLYEDMGDYEKAEPLFKQALEINRKVLGENHPDYALSLNNLATLYAHMGYYIKAEELLKQALEIRRKAQGEGHPEYANGLNNLATLYDDMGDYTKAEQLLKQALEINKKVSGENNSEVAQSLHYLARLYEHMGDYKKAEQLYIQALEIRRKVLGENHPYFSASLSNLAMLYDDMGDYKKAELLYTQALEIDRKILGENHPEFAISLSNLGIFYEHMGDYTKAELLYTQALEIDRKVLGENHPEFAGCLNNLANLYSHLGDYTKAEPLLKQALEINRKVLGENHPEFANNLNNLANIYNHLGDYTKAEPLLKQALEIRRKTLGENHPDFANSLTNLANLYEQYGDYTKSEPLYIQALEIRRKALGENHPQFAQSLINLATLYNDTGDFTKAELYFDSAHYILLKNINENYSFLSEQEKGKYNSTILFNFQNYCGFVYRNYTHLPSSVIHGFNNMLATNFLLLNSNLEMKHDIKYSNDSALQNKYTEWTALRKKIAAAGNLSIAERENRGINMDSLDEQANKMEKELARKSAVFAERNENEIDYLSVRNALSKGEAAIEFSGFKYNNGKKITDSFLYCAYIVRKEDNVPVYIPLFEEKQLLPLLAAVTQSGRGVKITNESTSRSDSIYYALYQLVWGKLEPYLQGANTVYITPSGLLNKLSFESLKDGAGSYLMNKYQLHHLLSSRDIVQLKKATATDDTKSIALFGGAKFDMNPQTMQELAAKNKQTDSDNEYITHRGIQRNGNTLSPWSYLPGTLDEVTNITATLDEKGWHCELDTATLATEEQLKALSGNNTPEIIHIATHGFYLPAPENKIKNTDQSNTYTLASDPMLRSGIILSGANYKWVDDKDIPNTENGIVTALDISNLDFTNASLAVLSACETGLGDIQSGEGVYGLQRAFRLAGVESMLISLWSVPDKETAQMMQLFYSNFSNRNISYYDAFASAQMTMQKQYPGEPLKWAGFELVGQ